MTDGTPPSIDTLDLDAHTLAPRRDYSSQGAGSHDIRIDGVHMVGTRTSADSGVRAVDVTAAEPFVVQMMNEAFTAAYPIAEGAAFTVPVANPPDPVVRTQEWRVIGVDTLETARGKIPCLVIAIAARPITVWVEARDHNLVWLRWLLPDGSMVWKLPARDVPFRGRNRLSLFAYFTGHWRCAGAFASGKPIASDMVFTPELEDHWLQYRHDDQAPNRYHALSLWGIDARTHALVSVVHDNFGGVRTFASSGWDGQRVVFDDDADHARFSYTVDTPTAFRMRYEASRDSGRTWALGDSLRCVRSRS
jgi:hypothetical protein